jgi:hypothetical protein
MEYMFQGASNFSQDPHWKINDRCITTSIFQGSGIVASI